MHGSVEWLWQIPAVSIPVLLLLASALAGVDSRAGAVWPRWGAALRRLRRSRVIVQAGGRQSDGSVAVGADLTSGGPDSSFNTYRRADHHARRQRRRANLKAHRDRVTTALQPLGAVSYVYRWGLGTVSLAVAVALICGYLKFLS